MSKFQKLIYTIAKAIKDDDFIPYLKCLYRNENVDRQSLMIKLQKIYENLPSLETARDLITEIKVSVYLAKIRGVNKLILSDRPDIFLKLNNFNLAIEVKRFRFWIKEDEIDESNLKEYTGDLKEYGNPEFIQSKVEEVIIKKINSYKGSDSYYLYLWSDSPHQVEDSEIKSAIHSVWKIYPKGFDRIQGVFYKWASKPLNLVLFGNNQINDILIDAFRESKWSFKIYN